MQKIIMLTFRGNTFYFVDKGFNGNDVSDMQNIANDISVVSKQKSENEIHSLFIETINQELGIELESVKISQIIRIRL